MDVYPGAERGGGGVVVVAELGLGQRALRGVLLNLAAYPWVTQACWASPTHDARLELRAPETAFSKGPKDTFAIPCPQIFLHTAYLLQTSSTLNLWPSDPGQVASPVWLWEKAGLHSQASCSRLWHFILWEG